MVAAVRRGLAMRRAAEKFGVAFATVQFWVARAGTQRLDRVDFSNRPRRPANRSTRGLEDLVLTLRRELKETSDLGECGAAAIHRALQARRIDDLPSVRTRSRIRERRGPGTDANASGALLPRPAGIGPTGGPDAPNWTASLASKAWGSGAASLSRSSTGSRGTAAWWPRGRWPPSRPGRPHRP